MGYFQVIVFNVFVVFVVQEILVMDIVYVFVVIIIFFIVGNFIDIYLYYIIEVFVFVVYIGINDGYNDFLFFFVFE